MPRQRRFVVNAGRWQDWSGIPPPEIVDANGLNVTIVQSMMRRGTIMQNQNYVCKRVCSSPITGLILLVGLLASPLSAATWFVAPGGADSGHDGTSGWDQAFATISNAIVKSANGDTVLVTNGHYYLKAALIINKNIVLQSVKGPEETFIDGSNAVQCVYFQNQTAGASTNAMLDGFTVIGGNAANGSAIRVEREGAWIKNCIVTSNNVDPAVRIGASFAFNGEDLSVFIENTGIINNPVGGMIVARSNVTIRSCVISGNNGKGLYIASALPNRLVNDCRILCNTNASYAGGVQHSGTAVFTNCLIAGNRSSGRGSGIYLASPGEYWNCDIVSNACSADTGGGVYIAADALFVNCRIDGNTAVGGGGLDVQSGSGGVCFSNCQVANNISSSHAGGIQLDANAVLYNCLIAGNQAANSVDRRGGGLHVGASVLAQCWNTTIAGNSAPDGGGVGGGVWISDTGTLNLNNSIVYGNSAGTSSSNWFLSAGGVITLTNSCMAPTNGLTEVAVSFDSEPQFVSPAGANFRLGHGSFCINSGSNQAWMSQATDLDGRPRLDRFSRLVDMGCYEYVAQGMLFNVR